MEIVRFFHYVRRAIEVGPVQTASIIANRVHARIFDRYWRHMALRKQAEHQWSDIVTVLKGPQQFEHFGQQLFVRAKDLLDLRHKILTMANEQHLHISADAYVDCTFDLLGSGPISFAKDTISWHEDFRLKQRNEKANAAFDKNAFYQDISVNSGESWTEQKDIKVLWELSRLQHLFMLGCAYQSYDEEKYRTAIIEQTINWLDNNPFLLGPNWLCPMDVGLRAINMVWAVALSLNDSVDQWWVRRMTCSIYDHLFYLENHWEIYDGRTSNHYLSDLVGYLYCCWFFLDAPNVQKKLRWIVQEIEREMAKQVFPDGSDYEGSTHYHLLVTELFYHASLVMSLCDIKVSEEFEQKLHAMFSFAAWCTPHKGKMISIGDHDSGKVVAGLDATVIEQAHNDAHNLKKDFNDFGLSIIKNEMWHISLRHHVYQKKQPSGHFHNDVGSMTLACGGYPIIVDPGSYLYTASTAWRNFFRSASIHNSFWVQDEEPIPFDERLFGLEMPEAAWQKMDNDNDSISMQHNLYARFGVRACRKLWFDADNQMITILDWWQALSACHVNRVIPTCWNFTLDSSITVEKHDHGLIMHVSQGIIMRMKSADLSFEINESFISPDYGIQKKTIALRAQKKLPLHTPVTMVWSVA